MDKNKFGQYVRQKRLENNYTQKELADQLMIDVSAVSKWERGIGYPDITLLSELSRLLGVSEHELIQSSNDTEYRTIKHMAQTYGKIKTAVFWGLTGGYGIAILTTFIVNLAVQGRLSWFFIVLAACGCGFTFAPTVTRFFERQKLTAFILTSFFGCFLLFLTCSIYTGNFWVWTASVGVALGYFALFWPILYAKQKSYLSLSAWRIFSRFFMITYAIGTLLLTVILLGIVNLYAPFDITLALKITGYSFVILFAYGLIELLPVRKLIRFGLECLATGGYFYGLNGVLNTLLGDNGIDYYRVDFSDWVHYSNGNITLIITGTLTLLGITLLVCGFLIKQTNRE